MIYVDIRDICIAYEKFANKILREELHTRSNSLEHIVNVCYPTPVTILQLAKIVQRTIVRFSKGGIKPSIKIVNTNEPCMFGESDRKAIKVDVTKALEFLGLEKLTSVEDSINEIVLQRMRRLESLS